MTRDSISLRGAGIVTVVQQKKGARFSLDSLLLADFCRIKPRDTVLEPGSGTGIISLLLAKKHPRSRITAIEIQPEPARICRTNIADNGLEENITLIEQDLRELKKSLKASSFDCIVANPPYRKAGTGRPSPALSRLSARHGCLGEIEDWLGLCRFLKNKGRYFLIFPSDRIPELMTAMQNRSLEPKRMRLVFPSADKPAAIVMLEAVKAARPGLQVLPPLIVHDANGGYSEEMRKIYSC